MEEKLGLDELYECVLKHLNFLSIAVPKDKVKVSRISREQYREDRIADRIITISPKGKDLFAKMIRVEQELAEVDGIFEYGLTKPVWSDDKGLGYYVYLLEDIINKREEVRSLAHELGHVWLYESSAYGRCVMPYLIESLKSESRLTKNFSEEERRKGDDAWDKVEEVNGRLRLLLEGWPEYLGKFVKRRYGREMEPDLWKIDLVGDYPDSSSLTHVDPYYIDGLDEETNQGIKDILKHYRVEDYGNGLALFERCLNFMHARKAAMFAVSDEELAKRILKPSLNDKLYDKIIGYFKDIRMPN